MTTQENQNLKVLIFDIETAPSLGWVWGKYDQDVISFDKNWYILSFAAKWMGSSKIISYSLADFPDYTKNREDDKKLVKKLWDLMDEADVIIAHNGDKFDIKKTNARFLVHGFNPPSPYKTVDTLKVARKMFAFDSNRLDDLGKVLGLGEKVSTGGFKLWQGCMAGDETSWKKMKKYNRQDVLLLEKVYLRLRPWMKFHPRVSYGSKQSCHCCGSCDTQRRGYSYSRCSKFIRIFCKKCGSWTQGRAEKDNVA